MINRIITTEDREKAARLRTLWDNRKKDLGLNQTKAAEQLGLNHQSTVSQYLNCDIAMNTDIVLRFAKLLDVDPAQIDPHIRKLVSTPIEKPAKSVPVSCKLELRGEHHMAVTAEILEITNPFQTKEPPKTELRSIELSTNAYSYAFGFPHLANVIVLVGSRPEVNDVVFVRQKNEKAGFYRFNGKQQDDLLLTDPLTSRNLTVPVDRITEFGACVGWLAGDIASRKSWEI